MIPGEEGHAAEIDAHVAFADAVTCRPYRYGRDGLNPDIQVFQIVHLTHGTVHHNAFPLVLCGNTGQLSINQCAAYGTTAIDHQYAATAVLFEQIVQQPVILETFHRDDLSAKRRPPTKVGEQRFNDVDIFLVDVTKLGGIVFHRFNAQLLRMCSVYRAKCVVGKIINC